ncbi:MAG: hypothetical protein V4697_02320 [Patescibacteria group bacterium]
MKFKSAAQKKAYDKALATLRAINFDEFWIKVRNSLNKRAGYSKWS